MAIGPVVTCSSIRIYLRACHLLLFCPSPNLFVVLSIHFAGRISCSVLIT